MRTNLVSTSKRTMTLTNTSHLANPYAEGVKTTSPGLTPQAATLGWEDVLIVQL